MIASSNDEYVPATPLELTRWMTENAAGPMRPVYPVGGRTALSYGFPVRQPGTSVALTGLARVIDYPARDMTITVEAGIRMEELSCVLAGERQRLPIDVPQAHRATLGGAVATNISSSRRFGLGTLRDYLIGVSAIDATGRLFKAGGRVVKNVAGYDLCKMLVGSLGTLAVITQLTLKLRPSPENSGLLWVAFDHLAAIDDVLEGLLGSAARPVALDLLDPRAAAAIAAEAKLELPCHRHVLCIGVEGATRETDWQLAALKTEISPHSPYEIVTVTGDDAARLWFGLTEFQVASDDPISFKATLKPSRVVEFVRIAESAGCAIQAHAGNGIIIGHLPDTTASAAVANERLAPLRTLVRGCGGQLTILHCDDNWKSDLNLFGDPTPAWPLMQKLKQELDPQGILNPHRFIDRL